MIKTWVIRFMCMFYWSLFVLLYFFFWPLCCLFFFDLRILITPLVSFDHCVVCSWNITAVWPVIRMIKKRSVILWFEEDFEDTKRVIRIRKSKFGIFWPLCCLFFFDLRILITSLWYLQSLLILSRPPVVSVVHET
jgi:hypothetical protein